MKNNIAYEMKRFGYQWLTDFSAFQKFSRGINVYINFYYHDLNTNKLKETPLFLLDKDELKNNKLTRKQQFENALNHIKIQKVFPNTIMDYFYYTDNRTVIPKEFIKEEIISSKLKQLTLF